MKESDFDRVPFSSWEQFLNSWREIARETTTRLEPDRAGCFVNLGNDWIDIMGALMDNYQHDELAQKITFLHFQGVFKEIFWLQLLFLGSNYPVAQSRLRFIWELIFHAYLADTSHRSSDADGPEPDLATKIEWMTHERRHWGWKGIRTALERLLPQQALPRIDDRYRILWRRLNRYVHPTPALIDRMIDPSALLIRDAFDKRWAIETADAATKVIDLVWLAIVRVFPKSARQILHAKLLVTYPMTDRVLKATV